jgi:hypothetical protein
MKTFCFRIVGLVGLLSFFLGVVFGSYDSVGLRLLLVLVVVCLNVFLAAILVPDRLLD